MLNNKCQLLLEYVLIITIISMVIIGMFFFLRNELIRLLDYYGEYLDRYYNGNKGGMFVVKKILINKK